MTQHPRMMLSSLQTALTDTPVVFLLGARQVGKTTLALACEEIVRENRVYYSFDDASLLAVAKADPVGFVRSLPEYVTLDEVQRVPELLPAIKLAVDQRRVPGRFLLTGSANLLLIPQVQESLAGRMEVVQLHTLAEAEKEHNIEQTLVKHWLDGRLATKVGRPEINDTLAERVVSGGYPEPAERTPLAAKRWFRNYIKAMIERDVKNVARIQDTQQLLRLLEILSLRTGNLLNISNLAQDIGMDRDTVDRYIAVLERLYLVRRIPAWHRNQAKRLIKAPKIHICDAGLASYLNRVTHEDWFRRRDLYGGVMESFVVQQMIAQADALELELHYTHYRDKDQVEVDLVISAGRDVYGIEVKCASKVQAGDERGLARLAEQAGSDFKGGILLYTGVHCQPLATRDCFAVPMQYLWANDL